MSHSTRYRSGLAFGWFDIMVLGLGLFGLIYLLLDQLVPEMLSTADTNIVHPDAVEGLQLVTDAWTYAPLFALLLAGFALIARATFESRLGG